MTAKSLPKAEAWNEEVTYVECPICGYTNELGSGLIFDKPWQHECENCHEDFMVSPP